MYGITPCMIHKLICCNISGKSNTWIYYLEVPEMTQVTCYVTPRVIRLGSVVPMHILYSSSLRYKTHGIGQCGWWYSDMETRSKAATITILFCWLDINISFYVVKNHKNRLSRYFTSPFLVVYLIRVITAWNKCDYATPPISGNVVRLKQVGDSRERGKW